MNIKDVCDICGGKLQFVHKGTRDNAGIDVYKCEKCKTIQLGMNPENDYENGFMNGKSKLSEYEISKRIHECEKDDKRRAKLVEPWCINKDILDFGCGFGGFMKYISDKVKSVSGVEVSRSEREYLQRKGYNVFDKINAENRYDVITLFHVFEHLDKPIYWLDIFAESIKSGGYYL